MEFTFRKDTIGWVVIRDGYPYEYHAHVKTKSACRLLVDLIHKGKLPRSEWLVGSCRRLLTDEEFARLKKPKDKYINRAVR